VTEPYDIHLEVQDARNLSLPSAPFDSVFLPGFLLRTVRASDIQPVIS